MKIIVDAFGGDHAPLAVIEGCRQAVDELGAEILLTGDEEKIRQAAAEAKISLDGMEIEGLVGSLAGDDTVILIMRNNQLAADLCREMAAMLE